jgi:glycosyltransferase involved in cell wall biosynthesis
MIILDLFGSSGGVGRCTNEILRQLIAMKVSTVLCGESHVVDSFKSHQPETPYLRLANLEQPRFSLKSLKLKFARSCRSNSPRMANVLLEAAMTTAPSGEEIAPLPILVNYPQVIAPPSHGRTFCLFLHDLNWRLYPGNFRQPDLTDRHCRGWVERAAKVITNSECTRREVIEQYQYPPEKVVAAPLASFTGSISKAFDTSKYLTSLGLAPEGYFLFPGVWAIHKGHQTLTEAIEAADGTAPVVVTCGMPLAGLMAATEAVAAMRRSLASRWDKLIAEKKLIVVGGVSELEMQALRVSCRAYVLPSQYEGFGFPLVEAIYHHRPAIVSDIKAHQEILQRYPQYNLATLFPPNSSAALAHALNRAVEPASTPTEWQKNIESTWSWNSTTQKLLAALNS